MPKVKLNDVELYYETAGSGPPVVFIHGGFASLYSALRRLAPHDWSWEWEFARHFHFTWYDRRGCYRSSRPEDGYGLEDQARDLAGLLDHLGLEAVHVIASSAGGPVAMLFAALRANRVRSLTLVGTGLALFPAGDQASDIIREQLQLLAQEGPEAAFDRRPEGVEISFDILWEGPEAAARGNFEAFLERQRLLAEQAGQIPKPERVRFYTIELKNIRAYIAIDVAPYARQITAPTLIMHGSNDQIVPLAWANELAVTIPAAQLHVVEGGPHGLIFRHAEARRRAIQFMRSCI